MKVSKALCFLFLSILFIHGFVFAEDHWECAWNNNRTCKYWRDSTQNFCCLQTVEERVNDKINLRADLIVQNETIATKTEQIANNFTNEVANLTAEANQIISDAEAMVESDTVSIAYRNSELVMMRDVWGANITQADLDA